MSGPKRATLSLSGSYRPGDQRVTIKGVEKRLRLSVSALAEIADRLNAASPTALGARLRKATSKDWNIVVQAVAEPRPVGPISQSDLGNMMPTLSAVIAKGLGA